MADHLLLPDPRRLPSRRVSGSGAGGPARHWGQHGGHLETQLAQVVRAPRRINQGVDPRLVFKIRAASRPADTGFQGRGLQILGETVDYTYFVMSDDNGAALSAAISSYSSGGVQRSFFEDRKSVV